MGMSGNLKVFVLLAGLTGLFGTIGYFLGGTQGMLIALALAAAMNAFAYFGSAKMVLRAYRAQVVTAHSAPKLYAAVERLRRRAGLPMPTVAIAPQRQPNAFATGRNPDNAVVCVTEGLLNLVTEDELDGVIAHELGHIKHRDILLQTVTATLAGAITNLAQFGMFSGAAGRRGGSGGGLLGIVFLILGPIGAMLVQFAISRQREFKADRAGAEITGRPLALARALRKLQSAAQRTPMNISPAVAPLAQVNPFAGRRGLSKLFSTHPPTEERIRRLHELADTVSRAA